MQGDNIVRVVNERGDRASFVASPAVTGRPSDNLFLVHLILENGPDDPGKELFDPLPKAEAILQAERYAKDNGWRRPQSSGRDNSTPTSMTTGIHSILNRLAASG